MWANQTQPKPTYHLLVRRSKLNSLWGTEIGQQAQFFCLHPLFTSTRRKRATVNPAAWQSLQVCSEAEKCCNKQVLPPSITPFIPHLKCSGLLALLSVKSPSSCLTLLREHDGHPCHSEWLQHSDAPNLSFRQVNLWIIYFYVVSEYVDSSQVRSAAHAGLRGGQDSLTKRSELTLIGHR